MAAPNLIQPKIALVICAAGNQDCTTDGWAALTGLHSNDIFIVATIENSLVLSYTESVKHTELTNKYDIVLFTNSALPNPDVSYETFLTVVHNFWLSPRTMCIDFSGVGDGHKNEFPGSSANILPFEFCSSFGLECFGVKTKELKHLGFLSLDFKYDEGSTEEYAFRQLGAQLLPSVSKVAFISNIPTSSTSPRDEEQTKHADEFAARYFVENHGRDWDLVFSSYLPIDIQKSNHFATKRDGWEKSLSSHEKTLYTRTLHIGKPTATLRFDDNMIASRLHGIIRPMTLPQAANVLNPWYYYLSLGSYKITPGIDGLEPAKALDDRKAFMEHMLIEQVLERYNFNGKKILDAGSNCGFFSAVYAQHGAVSFTGIEGRLQHVHQGQLYWGTNDFISGSHYEFIHANIDDSSTWKKLDARNEFDFTLCAGLLYHLPNPIETLRNLAQRTREVIVVDSRISQEAKPIKEKGGCSFDAIVQTRDKINPKLADLVNVLNAEGFNVTNITSENQITGDIPAVDDYNKGNRVTLYAERRK